MIFRRALWQWLAVAGCALLVMSLVLVGCGGGDEGDGPTVALLLLENESSLYEASDRSALESAIQERCDSCEILYSSPGEENFNHPEENVSRQQRQAEAALKKGAKVLVVDPVDPKAAAEIVAKAKARNVPVVSYEGLIENAEIDAYVSYDDEEAGRVQAEMLARKLKEDGNPSGPIIMANGEAGNLKAALLEKGMKRAFERAGVEIVEEYNSEGWMEFALKKTDEAITAVGKNGFAAISAADESTTGGAISALRGVYLNVGKRLVAGQDATAASIQRIIIGEQYLAVYKEIELEAKAGAEIAISLAEGKDVPEDQINGEVNNGKADIPSALSESIAVTRDNVKSTVIADGFVKPKEICEFYEGSCEDLGISG
jgi:D-xylose transport system substrate-binding protein